MNDESIRSVTVDGSPVRFRLHHDEASDSEHGSIHGSCDGPPHREADLGPAGPEGLRSLSDEQLTELWRAKWRIGA